MEKVVVKPTKRGKLSLRCPGSNCDPNKEYDWNCPNCRGQIVYDFNSFFYCECGQAPAVTYEFRCAGPKHGFDDEKFRTEKSLNDLLGRMSAFKEMNILILGETGVGKSIWFNSFANYLRFETLEEAQENDLVSLIPGEFTLCDVDCNEITMRTGEGRNEANKAGQSATQECKVYSLEAGDRIIRLIDTPGIGDNCGVDQDSKNVENILKTLSKLDELHGICILLKPNNFRLSVMFHFRIKELSTYLHRDASHNIMFCFTNSRGTFYRPGDTMKALKALLAEYKDVEIHISNHTIYCYDSEAYRFLAATKSNIMFSKDEQENFSKSWQKSISETRRMLRHIDGLKPHPIKSTLSFNHARNLADKLSRPLAEIIKLILTNKKILEDQVKEISTNVTYIQYLKTRELTSNGVQFEEDELVMQLLKSKLSDSDKNKVLIAYSKNKDIAEYKQEQLQIEKASAKFGHFLKNNAITPYNDAMLEYMDYLIKEEKSKVAVGDSSGTLDQLELAKESYKQQILLLEAEMDKGGRGGSSEKTLFLGDIYLLVKNLYKLKHNGKAIQKAVDAIDHTVTKRQPKSTLHSGESLKE